MIKHLRLVAAIALSLLAAPLVQAQSLPFPGAVEGDVDLKDFKFTSGEKLPVLRIHYLTLGTPIRDAAGQIANAVLVLHGTGGSGRQFLSPQFAGELYGPGQPLDLARYYLILPDGIGHGKSSKPSDGLRMAFPAYDYADMVEAQRRLLVDTLGVTHLRLLIGTSMGCMHAFIWGEAHPGFAEALMPLACLPVQIAGVNRAWRKLAIDSIRSDPAWQGGNYLAQPVVGLRGATSLLAIAGTAPLAWQAQFPTRESIDAAIPERVSRDIITRDANDLLYQLEASRTYDPSQTLGTITVPVTWINSADDFINPPVLGIAEPAAARLPLGRFVLVPATIDGKGHGTHSWAKFWKSELIALLARSGRAAPSSPR